jgi:hypothetical protein
MTQPNSVPQLNLAPQLNRPLSLWNPFDYLRFLYWIFFFPQALRWYEEQYLIDNKSHQIKLWIQGSLLTVIIPVSICKLLEEIGYSIDWSEVYFGIILGVGTVVFVQRLAACFGGHLWVVYGVAWFIIYGTTLSVTDCLLTPLGFYGFGVWLFSGILLNLILSIWFSWELDLAHTLPNNISSLINLLKMIAVLLFFLPIVSFIAKTYGIAYSILFLMISIVICLVGKYGTPTKLAVEYSLIAGVALCILLIFNSSTYQFIILVKISEIILFYFYFLLFFIGSFVVILRPVTWLIGLLLDEEKIKKNSLLFPRITPIPLAFLTTHLTTWLRQDWPVGLHNANELLRYSHQFIPVVKAINQVLPETPSEQLIFRVSQLATNSTGWQLVKYASFSLSEQFQLELKGRRSSELMFTLKPRLDTPSAATAAGFWYLYKECPEAAMEAFDIVRTLMYGEEMLILAQILNQLQEVTYYSELNLDDEYEEEEDDDDDCELNQQVKTIEKLNNIAAIELPTFPSEPLLRPTTWKVLNSLQSVILDLQFIVGETSESTHNSVLSRAIHKLQEIVDNGDTIPEAERNLVINISLTFKEILEEMI